MPCERHKKLESPYTPSGIAVWVVIGELARNLGDWGLTLDGVLRGGILEGDILYAEKYFEAHQEEVISRLQAQSLWFKRQERLSLKAEPTHP